jgi:hypothetical protein
VTALVALALAAAPGCPEALAGAAAAPADALGERAPALVERLEKVGAGGPTTALAAAARALAAAGASPPARELAAASFRGALSRHCALAALPAPPAASPADREALAAILARPELSRARSDPYALRRALERLWGWFVGLLGTEEAERYASLGRALFLGVAAGAAVLAAAALRRRRQERKVAAEPRGAGRADARVAPDASAARAEEALRSGDGRGAVRYALLAALGALERAGRVPRGRALTNGEVVVAVSVASPTLSSDLALLARAFDRAVYGGQAVAAGEARGAVEASRRIAALAGGAP